VHGPTDDDGVFDVDALMAEADRRPFRFRWAGEVWEFPPSMDIRVVDHVDNGRILEAVEMLMGADQWTRLVEVPEILDAVTLKLVLDRYVEVQGLTVPNSARPTPTSGRGRSR
jgi:hypothetical protein